MVTMAKVNFPEADRDITQYVLVSICGKLWWQMVTMEKVNFPEADRDITQYVLVSICGLLLLVCVSFTIIGQPRNSVLIRRV